MLPREKNCGRVEEREGGRKGRRRKERREKGRNFTTDYLILFFVFFFKRFALLTFSGLVHCGVIPEHQQNNVPRIELTRDQSPRSTSVAICKLVSSSGHNGNCF